MSTHLPIVRSTDRTVEMDSQLVHWLLVLAIVKNSGDLGLDFFAGVRASFSVLF